MFLYAGCEDGRIAALFADVYGIPFMGVECDTELVKIARENIATSPII